MLATSRQCAEPGPLPSKMPRIIFGHHKIRCGAKFVSLASKPAITTPTKIAAIELFEDSRHT